MVERYKTIRKGRRRGNETVSVLADVSESEYEEYAPRGGIRTGSARMLLRTAVSTQAIQSIVCGPSDLRVSATCTTVVSCSRSVGERESDALMYSFA
jgi:hypothetical protein